MQAALELRIVSGETFAAVQRRFETTKRVFGREGGGLTAGQKRYLFSGLLKCGVCGGSIVLVCGRGRHGADRYGCAMHHQRGDAVCANALLVRRDDLEDRLLKRISDTVLREEVVEYAIAGMKEELQKQFQGVNAELKQARVQKRQIEEELARVVRAIADGQPSKSLTAAIAGRKRELGAKLESLKTFAIPRLSNLRELISRPQSVDQARAALADHFGRFTLQPVADSNQHSYIAHGEIDLFGEEAMARAGGAGGPACT